MDREGAETYLRLLGEAQLRDMLPPAPRARPQGPGRGRSRMLVVSQALAAVGTLDAGTAADIVAEFDLAMYVRDLHRQAGPGAGMAPGAGTGTVPAAAVARVALRMRPGLAVPPPWPGMPPVSWASGSVPVAAGLRGPGPQGKGPQGTRPQGTGPQGREVSGDTELCVPAGLTVPFRDEGIDGELYLLAFARSGSGARLITLWGQRTTALERQRGLQHPGMLPLRLFTVTDDRGTRYELDFGPGAGPEWASEIRLRPDPPGDIRWLDVSAPPGPAVRVGLNPACGPAAGPAEVIETALSPGEQLLILLAEQLLIVAPQFERNLHAGPGQPRGLPAVASRPVQAIAAGFGDMVAALEAADVLSPHSPVPGRLAALCASLGADGHGIAAPPAPGLPEPWLSLLAHYQRRRPDPVPVHDGYAAVAAVLPELDGIRLAVCGLHNAQGCTVLHLLAGGVTADGRHGPHGVDMDFPLSVWLRDSGGRWHTSHLVGRHQAGQEYAIGLQVVPPLPLTTPWVDLLAAGRAAEVRVRLPVLGWHPW